MQKLPYRLQSKLDNEVKKLEAYEAVVEKWDELVGAAKFMNKAGDYADAFVYPSQRDVEDGYTYEDDGNVHSHFMGVHVGVGFGQETKHYVADEKVVKSLAKKLAVECANELASINEYYAARALQLAPLVEKVELAEVELERAQSHVRAVENEIDALLN